MKIKNIKKVGSNKYHLLLENGKKIVTYDESILKYNLLYKKEIDSELMDTLLGEASYYEVYQKVIKYVSVRLRSEYEIKKYLEKFQLSQKDEQTMLEKLKQTGVLNDQKFAASFISDKLYLSTMGPLKIKAELLNYQIDSMIIEDELSKIDEQVVFDKLYKMVTKKVRSNKKYSAYILHQKLFAYFKDLGYDADMIEQCLSEVNEKDYHILEQEAEKLYKKLSKKYHGNELTKKVKEKLYQKGFDINDITTYIK